MGSKRPLSNAPNPIKAVAEEKIPKKTKALLGKVPNSSESLLRVFLAPAFLLSMQFIMFLNAENICLFGVFLVVLTWMVIGTQCRKTVLGVLMSSRPLRMT